MRRLTIMLAIAFEAQTALAAPIAPHRASYALQLDDADPSISGAYGAMRMALEDVCDGYAASQLFAAIADFADGGESGVAIAHSAYESKDGETFRFRTRFDSTLIEGDFSRSPTGAQTRLAKPEPLTADMPKGTLTPVAHLSALLDAARAGELRHSALIYDGREDGGAHYAATHISPYTAQNPPEELAGMDAWRFDQSIFDYAEPDAEPLQIFKGVVYENGVYGSVSFQFGALTLSGELKSLTMLPPGC